MRIAFVGLPLAALLLHADGHEIVWAGVCRRDALGTRRLRRTIGRDNVSMMPDLDRLAASVAARKPDLVVSWFWTRKVPASFRTIAPLGAIGVHPSLLPRHRGPDPYFWAIDAGDTVTGVTAHQLDDAYDTGAILAKRELAIDPSWSAWRLAKKLDRPSLALLRETVRAFADGRAPPPLPQDDALATEAPQPTDDDLEIRWTEDAASIERRVRAASPWPGAFTAIGDVALTLTRVRATTSSPKLIAALEPGEAIVRDDGIAMVRARAGAVELLAGRSDDDDDERELDATALAALIR
ncbi:MAG: methionyl-tRNA formyltransferase [Myxococcales bacterium]|jgi:methionyl-tRNA formyltransferase|nr:methionyl-tRNA formyltransferase [Myxococcales bacterium]